jgi:hypothetical protein
VVTALGVDVERLRLRVESRQGLRASQRVASRLHQLISATLVVGGLDSETDIAEQLVRTARSVFDADLAAVCVAQDEGEVRTTVQRGRIPKVWSTEDSKDPRLPTTRLDAREPWT